MIEKQLYQEGLKLLSDLVSVESISPSGENYEQVVQVLKEFFSKTPVNVDVLRVPQDYQRKYCSHVSDSPRFIVRASLGEGEAWLEFNGHYDVVPGGPGWTVTEPFKPKIVGTRVYGRGTTDMKGGLTSMALAMAMLAENDNIPMKVTAVFVPDEEVGGECGTGYYVESLGNNLPNYVVIAEPSTTKQIYIGHKGGIWLRITVKGRTAHASTPWLGENAFTRMAKLVTWLEENYVSTLQERKSKYTYDLPEGNIPTAMIGGEAGVPSGKANQVPGAAFFTIDRRSIVEEDLDDVYEELVNAIKEGAARTGIGEENVDISVMTRVAPAFVEPSNKLSQSIIENAPSVGLPQPREIVCIGGLDLRYYSAKGVTAVAYGPGVLNMAHAPDEYVDYDEVYRVAQVYARLPYTLSK